MASKKGKPAPLGEASSKKGSKKEPPPPRPRTLAALEAKAAEERAERDSAVQEFLETVLERVDALEEEKEIQAMLIPYAVDRVLDEAMKALELVMLPKPVDWREEGTGNWAPDEEPEVPVIDNWARGAIPIKKRPPPAVSEPRSPTLMSPSGLSRTTFKSGAGASVRASRSPSRRVSNSGGSIKGDRAESVVSNSRINTSTMKRLVDLSARAPLPNLPAAAPPLPKLMQEVQARKKELASANAEEDQRLREELAARQAQEKLRKEREERDAAEAARLAVEAQKALAAEKGAAGVLEAKNNLARARSKRSLTREVSKSGGATSAASAAPPPVLTQAPANGSAKQADGKPNGKAGVSEAGAEKAGALADAAKQPSDEQLKKGANGLRSPVGVLRKEPGPVVKPSERAATRKSGEGLKAAASSERRAGALVLPVIEKPKSR